MSTTDRHDSRSSAHLVPRPDWLPREVWPFQARAVEVDGERIAYVDVGAGPVLVFVHTGMWQILWRDLVLAMQSEFRCVTIDAPTTGLSTGRGRGVTTIADAGTAVSAVVESLDLRDLTLVFHDLGGPAALHAADGWPDRVRALVAVNTFGWRPRGALFTGMLAAMGSVPIRELDAVTGFLPRMASTSAGVGKRLDRASRRAFRRGMPAARRRSFHRYMRDARKANYSRIESTAARLADRPLLTIFGQRNDPLKFQPQWAARFADMRQVEIPKGYHFPMCDDPQLVAEQIRAWYADRVDGRPGW